MPRENRSPFATVSGMVTIISISLDSKILFEKRIIGNLKLA